VAGATLRAWRDLLFRLRSLDNFPLSPSIERVGVRVAH
jgi:hypothetical protein